MPRATDRRYWLLKTEPGCFSYDDLLECPDQTAYWDGVRNYQARNFLRDDVRVGDGVLFYYSNAEPSGVVGTATVVRAGYPDHTALDPSEEHYDSKSTRENPIWYMVDIKAGERFRNFLALGDLRHAPALEKMELLRKGSRLSVMPVTAAEWKTVCAMGAGKRVR
jgi:predicted RNA-binding protein with PUA-like domain